MPVAVVGLRDLQRTLRKASAEIPKELRKLNKDAAETVQQAARLRAKRLGGVAAKSAPAVLTTGTSATKSAVTLSRSSRHPYAFGAEFGSLQYKQFRRWRGNGDDAGYFFLPAVKAETDRFAEHYAERIIEFMSSL